MNRFKFYSMSIFLALTLLVGCPDDDSDDGAGGAVSMGGAVGMGGAMGMGGVVQNPCGEASGPPIMPETMPDGTEDEPYEQDLEALGGSQEGLTWTIETGALPTGLALDGATGTVAGTPTESGAFTFEVMVTVPPSRCPVQPGFGEYTVTIQPIPPG